MKQQKIYLAALCCLFCFQASWGQTYKYPLDNGNSSDNIINACLEYVRKNHIYSGEQTVNRSAKYYKFPNNHGVVVTSFKLSHKEKQVLHSDIGFFDPTQGWSKTATMIKTVNNTMVFAVFVNEYGTPIKAVPTTPRVDIKLLKGNKVLFLEGFEVGYKDIKEPYFFRLLNCYSIDGSLVWTSDNGMVYWDYAVTDNYIYIVGAYENCEYKVLSINDGIVQSDNRIAEKGYRYTNIALKADGIHISRYDISRKTTKNVFVHYESADKDFQQSLIMGSYNKNKATDQVSIGNRYLKGNGFQKNEKNAFEWYMKSAEQNHAVGLERVGYCYQNGIGIGQDKAKAVTFYERAANENNKDAIKAVVKMYINGDGIPKNMSRAMYWQEKLAFQGDKEAQKFVVANQSIEYEKTNISASEVRDKALLGYGLKDYEWAEFCIKRAIDLGDNDARLDYGLWLAKGEGVQKDYAKAEEYLTFFAESGIAEAVAALSKIYLSLNDQKKALYWTEKAALQGDAEAQYKMAVHYENGVGVKKNAEAAFDMFKRAADNGNQEAIRRLVLAYGLGKGVKKDYNASVSYFDKLDLPTASLLANNVFWGENGMKKNKTLGLLLLHRAGYRGDKRSAELWEIYNK